MARPERKKLLIVLSDGLPSNYNGSPTGKDDVRSAVDIAIRSGISVISNYFGGDYEDVTRTFAWMYGENRSIVCDPDRLTEQLSKKNEAVLLQKMNNRACCIKQWALILATCQETCIHIFILFKN